ncbi:ESX secretion-associated protein EspG [Saccharomonospora cyanea]|uniref:EspG family n=1 Tax=Saccharomonospora cyanea NA-134 TaxID=882082 RepID=H5XHG2_9PSEU|nr:ESX secretion-associated protein EspG [Saccharomonospora cyanea]EHR61642.1 hypothetical protein SaccyDRAFT_2796 [Saccharomonospora cyanea NA-134]
MTVTAHQGVSIGLLELDLLATYAGTRPPFPLRAPSFGRIEDERRTLLASAGRTLAERGLAREHGPVGVAAELVTALREYRSAVDLVVVAGGTVTGVVAMSYGPRAVVCRQSIGGTPGPVSVERIATDSLSDEVIGHIPKVEAAPTMPITLPPGVVGDATRLLENTAGAVAPRERVRALVRERGGNADAVDMLVSLLPSLVGRGQLGAVVRRAGGVVERPLELSWLDSPRGRVRVSRDGNGWTSVNPLRHSDLVRFVRDATASANG